MNLVLGITITPGIDLDALGDELIKAFHTGLKNLAIDAMNEWKDEAGRQLHRTARSYMDALSTHVINDEEIEIILHHPNKDKNWVVTALEVGVEEFKLKPPRLAGHSGNHWSQFHKTSPGGAKSGVPFVDIPFRTGPAMEQKTPDKWRRMTEASPAAWVHPGFKPSGSGGLKTPLREHIKEYIEKQAEMTFSPLIARIRL